MVTEVEHLLLGKMPIVNTPFVLAETPRQIQVRPQMVLSFFYDAVVCARGSGNTGGSLDVPGLRPGQRLAGPGMPGRDAAPGCG